MAGDQRIYETATRSEFNEKETDMRHRQSHRKLNRTSSHRKAMFRNMACALLQHESIQTTVPKAKDLRGIVERLVTLGKNDSVAARRRAFDALRDKALVAKLFTDLGPRFKSRPGGYLRVLKNGYRDGDKAPMAVIQFVEESNDAS